MKEKPILFSGEMVRAILDGRKTQTRRVLRPQPPENSTIATLEEWATGLAHTCGVTPTNGEIKNKTQRLYGHVFPIRKSDGRLYSPRCPYGVPGDRLYLKETHYLYGYWVENGLTKSGKQKYRFIHHKEFGVLFPNNPPFYSCRSKTEAGWFRRSPLFMPRWASRITLEITDVRVQRVQDISELDAKAEGASPGPWYIPYDKPLEGYQLENFTPDELKYLTSQNILGYGKNSISWRNGFANLWDSINFKRGFGWGVNPWVWAITFKRLEADK